MPLVPRSLNTSQYRIAAIAVGLFALSLALRLPGLDAMVNVDMYHLWAKRIDLFWNCLAKGDLAGTYQSHHPGVTFMWAAGALWRLFGVTTPGVDSIRLTLATLPALLVGSLFPAATFWLTLRAWGHRQLPAALLIALLFATEPLFVAHSCNAHLDMLVTSFAWSSVLLAVVSLQENRVAWAVASGILLGLALLTKLSAVGYALGIALLFVVVTLGQSSRLRPHARRLALLAVVSLLTVVVLWPALWVAPLTTLERLFAGLRNEVDKISAFMFLGQTGKLKLPSSIYGIFALFLATPEFVLPVVLGAVSLLAAPAPVRRHAGYVTLATLPLASLILSGSRVGVRYLIPLLPCVGTLSALALASGFEYLQKRSSRLAYALFGALFLWRLVRIAALQPLPITYCSTWTQLDCAELFHLGWGEGMKEAAQYVDSKERSHFHRRPIFIYGSPYATLMGTWTSVKSVSNLAQAELLVEYLSDWQRELKTSKRITEWVRAHDAEPLHVVTLQGRPYVRIYAGPKY